MKQRNSLKQAREKPEQRLEKREDLEEKDLF